MRPHSHTRCSCGFPLVELLVVSAIIGVLIGLLLPAVQAARESARATQCKNNLKQIALAAQNFADVRGAFPPSRYQSNPSDPPGMDCGGKQPSWIVRLLPFVEEVSAAVQWDISDDFENHPDSLRSLAMQVFVCPSRRSRAEAVIPTVTKDIKLPCGCPGGTQTFHGGAVTDYAGNHGDLAGGIGGGPNDFYWGGNGTGVIISRRPRCANGRPVDWLNRVGARDVTDGLSKTFLLGERHVMLDMRREVPHDMPMYSGLHFMAHSRIGGPGVPIARTPSWDDPNLANFGSWHPGICHFALSDGSVRSVNNAINTVTLARLCNRSDGETIDEY